MLNLMEGISILMKRQRKSTAHTAWTTETRTEAKKHNIAKPPAKSMKNTLH